MAISRIFLWLGYSLMFFGVLMLVTAGVALLLQEFLDAQMFVASAAIVGVLGMIIGFTAQNAPHREGSRDLLIFLLLFWLFIPLFSAMPYFISPVYPGFVGSYFDTVSAITTTGAASFEHAELSKSMLFWRSLLQWSGGAIVATFAVVILAALNLSGTGVHRSVLFTLKKGELFKRLISIGRIIAGLYLVFALVCALLLVMTGTPVFEAVCLGLTSVSTGGLTPRAGPLESYVSGIGVFALVITCLLGAVNIAVVWEFLRRRTLTSFIQLVRNVEYRGILVMISFLIVVGFLFTGTMHLHTVIVEAVFMATTTGFDYHVIGIDIVPPVILIALVLVGGSALSTAGGLKIIRMLLLLRHTRTDIDRMSHPSRVRPVRFQGKTIDDSSFLSIWMYFFAYTMAFAMGITAMGAAGLEFTAAVSASAAALSNTGPLLAATSPEITYSGMNDTQLLILSLIMIVGRLEVLAVLAAISPSLWRR